MFSYTTTIQSSVWGSPTLLHLSNLQSSFQCRTYSSDANSSTFFIAFFFQTKVQSTITTPFSCHVSLVSFTRSRLVMFNSATLWAAALLCPWDSPGKNTGVGAIVFSRGSSRPRDQTRVSCISCLCRQILYPLRHWGSSQSPSTWINSSAFTCLLRYRHFKRIQVSNLTEFVSVWFLLSLWLDSGDRSMAGMNDPGVIFCSQGIDPELY